MRAEGGDGMYMRVGTRVQVEGKLGYDSREKIGARFYRDESELITSFLATVDIFLQLSTIMACWFKLEEI